KKSSLVPLQKMEFLGVMLDLRNHTLSVPQDKITKVMSRCQGYLQQEVTTRRELESLVGYLNFVASYIPLGRLNLLHLIRWTNHHTSTDQRYRQIQFDVIFKVSQTPWTRSEFLSRPVPMHVPSPSLDVMTDASLHGWSGILLPHREVGIWGKDVVDFSMNWKELKAIHLSILRFGGLLRGRTVRILSDNSTALSCLRKQGSLSSETLVLDQDNPGALPGSAHSADPGASPGRLERVSGSGIQRGSDLHSGPWTRRPSARSAIGSVARRWTSL
ncbi:unnamed protein product, partial [Meganyctiphanes norvegica]